MKKILISLCLLPAMAFGQTREFTINADFGPDVVNKVLFNRYTLSTGQHKDTVTTTNGQVVFKGTVNEERQIAQLVILSGDTRGSAVFYLEPGTINIRFPRKGVSGAPVVGGTPLNEDYQQYRLMISAKVDSAKAADTANYNVSEFTPQMRNSKFDAIARFISQHPESPINVDLLNQIAINFHEPEMLLIQYNKLTDKAKKSAEGKDLFDRIKGMGAAKVGDMAPDFTIPDTQGNPVSLSSFRGKYVLIDFWATWCAPCIAEMPNIVKAYSRYKDKNFEILGVSLDRPDSKERWLKNIVELEMTWPQLSDLKWWNCTPALLYNVNSVPASFLIDPQGQVVAVNLRGEALGEKLSEVLK
jgi:peroxiredoxin